LNFMVVQSIGSFVSLLIVGEALVLIVGLVFFKKPSLVWASAVNIALVLCDFLLGGYLFPKYFGFTNSRSALEVLGAMMVLIATHSFRASQTLRKAKNPYCFNQPLGVINWIKLLGLLILFIFAVQMK
jgi:hypothetical protein